MRIRALPILVNGEQTFSLAQECQEVLQNYFAPVSLAISRDLNSRFGVPQLRSIGPSMRYGDYGVVTPDFSELENPQLIVGRMGPNARYTLDNRWFVTRGRRFQTDGYDQYYTLAEQVASLAEFSGRTFSFGDEYIDVRANGNGTTGNPTTWIAACDESSPYVCCRPKLMAT